MRWPFSFLHQECQNGESDTIPLGDVLTKIKYFHSKFLLPTVKRCLARIWVEKEPFREGVVRAEVNSYNYCRSDLLEVLY